MAIQGWLFAGASISVRHNVNKLEPFFCIILVVSFFIFTEEKINFSITNALSDKDNVTSKGKKKKKRLSSIQFHSALSNPDQKACQQEGLAI